jgi:hypothetical protein
MASPKTVVSTLVVQDRDCIFLRGLFESRIMTAEHITMLYFDGRNEAAKKRLQKLKAAGFIAERKRHAFEPAILFLTRKAFAVLRERGVLAEYPQLDSSALEKRSRVSELTVRHELEIMDVKAAFHVALAADKKFSIAEFSTWPLLYQFDAFRSGHGGAEVLVKPDGFIRIHENESDGSLSEHTFFLEVDRSTETQDTLIARAGCYGDYYKSGGFAVRNGGTRADFKEYPFRVLMVFKSAERRNNTAERLLQHNPPIFSQVCLSTFEEVTANPQGEIWIRPMDYRHATAETPFAPGRMRETWGYRRQTEREMVVEKRIKKWRILHGDASG